MSGSMDGQIVLEGVIESIIFQNTDNGYTVFSMLPVSGTDVGESEKLDEVTCVAYMPNINEGENVLLSGSYVKHPVYGRQFNVEFYEIKMPSSTDGIAEYLASGVIKGVGAKTAQRIVEKFGENTIFVIEETPERLAEVKGISLEKAKAIGIIFKEQAELRHVTIFLQKFGISPVFSQKIHKKYKENTIDIIKANPYTLADDITGIGFKTADVIAAKLGMDRDSLFRVKAGIKYILRDAVNNGHVYLPRRILEQVSEEMLHVGGQLIADGLTQLHFERVIWQEQIGGEPVVYLNLYYYMENYVAKKLTELTLNVSGKTDVILQNVERIEKETGVTLAENQRLAAMEALSRGVLIITGGPGTGKTTTINTIIKLLQQEGYSIELAAPTGRAAKRMTEATGMDAKTIHRLLGSSFSDADGTDNQRFEKNEDSPLETDVIIIDESSMVDINLMYNLLKAVPYGTRLILVGDVDQLPSVGAGNVLKDVILSGMIPIVRLNEVFRQAQESAIIMNAHRINNGEYPLLNEKGKDFFFVKRTTLDNVVAAIIDLTTKRLPEYANCDSFRDIQVLTPMRKSELGVAGLNQALQSALNPPHPSKAEKEMRTVVYREGDKVMQIKNNYNMTWRVFNKYGQQTEEGTGVFNGDEGIIDKIDDINEIIKVKFDDERVVFYDYTQLDELELSYAITIHKSQGSEYKVVVIPVYNGPPMLMSRNLLYTAVTRAKELAVIVGIPETLYKMVDNNREINRYTSLSERIRKLGRLINESV